jgi:protein tyrosine phosphatase (PTP) superfamily phosphohydrolase (DUF442 family)
MAIDNSYNFKRVNDLVTTSGVVGANRLEGIGPEGYDVLINLLPNDSEYAVENEKEIVEKQGVKYVYIPVDFGNPALSDYDQFATALDEAKGNKVHIHCAANYRVSAFYALYAESRGLWRQSEAQEFVQSLWQPQEAQGWPEFIARVREQHCGAC